jgi:mono/diheme cytochrome c family protein
MTMTLAYLPRVLVPVIAAAIVALPGRLPASAAAPEAGPLAVPPAAEPDPTTAAPEAVVRVYRTTCLKCHDTDGKGEIVRDVMKTVPDFTDAAWHTTRNDADLGRSIHEGKGKSMPSMRGKLGSVDVGQMVAFVRGFRGGKQVVEEEEEKPAAPEQVAAAVPTTGPGSPTAGPSRPGPKDSNLREESRIFQRSCAVCHGSDGRGSDFRSTAPSIPDFTARAWQESRTDPRLVVSVLDGKGSEMPPFRDKFSREQVRDLVAFVRSFGPTPRRATRAPSDDFEARFQKLIVEFEELREKSRALSPEAASTRPGEPGPSTPPPGTPRNEAQSSGDGRRVPGG